MIRWQPLVVVLLLPVLCAFDPFHGKSKDVEQGNAKLAAGKLKEALEHYQRAARELPDEPGVQYNLGIAHHSLGQLDQARQALLRATGAGDPEVRAKAFYNLGNVQYEQKHFKEAVDAYRRTLQLRPGHRPSQWNLELALRRLREEEKKKQNQDKKDQKKDQKQDQKKQDQKKQDQKKDQKQDQKKQDQKKDQKQDQKKQDQKKDQKRDQKKQDQKKQDQAKKKPEPPPEMNQTLDALDRNDKNLQRQRARLQRDGDLSRPTKDW